MYGIVRLPADVPGKKCEADAFDSDLIQVKWPMIINPQLLGYAR